MFRLIPKFGKPRADCIHQDFSRRFWLGRCHLYLLRFPATATFAIRWPDHTIIRLTGRPVKRIFAIMVNTVITSDFMPKRLTIDVPDDLHEAFLRKCFLSKPRETMKQKIIAFIAHETGKPVPKSIDRRKLTKADKEAELKRPKR